MNLSLVEKALRIAAEAHQWQFRRTSGLPYLIHPVAVALKLAKHGFPDSVIAAALLHDVLEDTDYSSEKLKDEMGEEIFGMVTGVTYDNSLDYLEKRRKYLEIVKVSSAEVKAISIADKIHNLESILIEHEQLGSDIWKLFNMEKSQKLEFEEQSLKMFKETWDHPLIGEYEDLLKKVKNLA